MIPAIDRPVILASASPRRASLLRQVGVAFQVHPPRFEEPTAQHVSETAGTAATELAIRKVQAIAENHPRALIIGADTVVALQNRLLGKPADDREAKRMLRALSGHTHNVITGVALLLQPEASLHTFTAETIVRFRSLTDEEIARYVQTGESRDKAGAYGIQGKGALLVQLIRGDYNNVVGFPLTAFYVQLRKQHII
ncbi:MAG TPA: Maf family protein [bacterium]|nr:Maf family protein [bacterium]